MTNMIKKNEMKTMNTDNRKAEYEWIDALVTEEADPVYVNVKTFSDYGNRVSKSNKNMQVPELNKKPFFDKKENAILEKCIDAGLWMEKIMLSEACTSIITVSCFKPIK